MIRIISRSVNDTLKIGSKIAGRLQCGDILCLFGKLGSGKTVLAKGIARGLKIKEKIISPTFVLIRQYPAQIPFYHFDLYRIKSPTGILALGYEEYLYDEGITVIEWADRLKYLLPKEYLRVELGIKNQRQRLLEISGLGRHYRELLEKINEDIRD